MLKGRRFTPAMIVAMIALAVALSGTAVAGTAKLITGSQIANGTIKLADIHSSAKTALKGRAARPARRAPAPRGPPAAGRHRREGRHGCDRRSRSQGRQGRDRRSWPAGAGVTRAFLEPLHRRCFALPVTSRVPMPVSLRRSMASSSARMPTEARPVVRSPSPQSNGLTSHRSRSCPTPSSTRRPTTTRSALRT